MRSGVSFCVIDSWKVEAQRIQQSWEWSSLINWAQQGLFMRTAGRIKHVNQSLTGQDWDQCHTTQLQSSQSDLFISSSEMTINKKEFIKTLLERHVLSLPPCRSCDGGFVLNLCSRDVSFILIFISELHQQAKPVFSNLRIMMDDGVVWTWGRVIRRALSVKMASVVWLSALTWSFCFRWQPSS